MIYQHTELCEGVTYDFWRDDTWTVELYVRKGRSTRLMLTENGNIVYTREYEYHLTPLAERDASTLVRFRQSAQKENAA